MSEPRKYRNKPVEIQAAQWDGTAEGAIPIINWILESGVHAAHFLAKGEWDYDMHSACIVINTLEGSIAATAGNFIIRGIKGEFYPCRADIFEATYEECGGDER